MSTTERLFSAVYEDPASDAPRQVLADHLMERGDPRGEFIALQLQKSGERLAKQLLKKHRADWLGPLASDLFPKQETWTRGFPSSALARLERNSAGDPRWNTLEMLDLSSGHDQATLKEPLFRALKDLRGARTDGLEAILAAREPPRLEALHTSCPRNVGNVFDASDIELILRLKALTTLTQLHLETRMVQFEVSQLDWLWKSELARQLKSLQLSIVYYQSKCLAGCLEAVEPLAGLTQFTLSPNYFSMQFSRGPDGRFSVLELRNHGATSAASSLDAIIDKLTELPNDALLAFRYRTKGRPFAAEIFQPLKDAVAKQKRLKKQSW